MGNIFSICTSKRKNKHNLNSDTNTNSDTNLNSNTHSNNSEYRKIKVKGKIYTLFKDIEPKDCFEI